MPIKLPNLDDRTFADLVAEAHTLIPVKAPEWTNHNESDPGITLVELFAYLTEMQIYRLNRVTDANVCAFLKLIDGVRRTPSSAGMVIRAVDSKEVALRDEVRDVVLKLRQQDRAVTSEDFERLALAADRKVTRAFCVPRRDLTAKRPYDVAEAHLSVVIVPTEVIFDTVLWFDGKVFSDVTGTAAGGGKSIPLKVPAAPANAYVYVGSSTVFESLSFSLARLGSGYTLAFEYFNGEDWLKLTTDDHKLVDNTSNLSASGSVTFNSPPDWKPTVVNNASMYWLRVSTSTAPDKAASAKRIFRDLIDRVSHYLEPRRLLTTRIHVVGPNPVPIGVHVNLTLKEDAVGETVKQDAVNRLTQFLNQQTWPFGRNVYVSEIYQLLSQIPGVDFITKINGTEIVTATDAGRSIKEGDELVAISLNQNELPNFSIENSEIVPVPPERIVK